VGRALELVVDVSADRGIPVVPLSTYRLQFSSRFRFTDAAEIVPYLAELGVGAIYASPYLRARPGSEHGYDVVDHNSLNPEIGTSEEHRALIETAQRHGIGHILDFVPNHMGISGITNPWWSDVLEWGQSSPFAKFFDIEWHPQRADLDGKVLLPFLGDHYGRTLESGELAPKFDRDRRTFVVSYYDLSFPLTPPSYAPILLRAAELATPDTATALRETAAVFSLDGRADDLRPSSMHGKERLGRLLRENAEAADAVERALEHWRVRNADASQMQHLHSLLEAQHYRLASWRVSLHEINYRRFFDINDLAALRIEDAEVLAQTHRLVFQMIEERRLQGLRIDHVDGLFNPGAYCRLLRERAALLNQPLYLVVEKILARFERLSRGWDVDGTTGYNFMNDVNELFVNPRSELAFDRIYAGYGGANEQFEDVAYAAKQNVMRNVLSSELTLLSHALFRIALSDVRSNDFTYEALRDAIASVVAWFPVYRTYISGEKVDEEDKRFIEWAVLQAQKRSRVLDESVFSFILDVLTRKILEQPHTTYDFDEVLHFTMKFQQYTGPVMAKAVEDTAFYRYVRLLSLNEVGGDPRRFGTPPATFHRHNQARADDFPHAMLATATHDHKRGEDTRLRIDALSEMPGRWRRALRIFHSLARQGSVVESVPAPSPKDEYALYQMIVGTWPSEWLNGGLQPSKEELERYVQRICEWLRKAMRESKLRTSWTRPDTAYEHAAIGFARRLFESAASRIFVRELQTLLRDVAPVAMISGLAQITLKLTSPGVPDTYQGCELWDFSMVDPDNRRDVDFVLRMRLLSELKERFATGDRLELVRDLLRSWQDGRVKMFVLWRLLQLRNGYPEIFLSGSYSRLGVAGRHRSSIVAFARERIVTVAPRLVYSVFRSNESGLPDPGFVNEYVSLPRRFPRRFRNVFTGAVIDAGADSQRPRLSVRDLLRDFPVAVLEPAGAQAGP
jgi:(1->4)-alpha-D-glucan 1-alpha-D-glucosylmutase